MENQECCASSWDLFKDKQLRDEAKLTHYGRYKTHSEI